MMEQTQHVLFIYSHPAFLTPHILIPPLIPFTTEEITGCPIDPAKDANQAPINLPIHFYFMFYYFSNSIN